MATENKNLSEYDKATIPNAKNFRFGIVVSEWNDTITEGLYKGAIQALLDNHVLAENIIRWNVPGSFELIYGCKKMQNKNVDVIIAIGCIIKGETDHYNYICQSVSNGITQLNIINNIPIVFCVLTDHNVQQSINRSGGKYGNKGIESAVAAIKIACIK